LQQVDLSYAASRLTLDTAETFAEGPTPGSQAPNAKGLLFKGALTSLYELSADDQFRLLLFTGTGSGETADLVVQAADTAMRFALWLTPYIVVSQTIQSDAIYSADHASLHDKEGDMHRSYAALTPCIYLIRADGYIAYRSLDINSVDQYFEHIKIAQ
ncbi:MAG: hypothetical protein AAGI44_17430, partial [Pseudomonadota bacterium]